MVIKGKSRTNGGQLAAYLQKLDGNERIQIIEHNSPHETLSETFRDWEVLADGVDGKKYLYHAQINPEARYAMTPEQYERAADVLETELRFTGQPRVIVFHEKDDGRQHAHVVWHRIDTEKMSLLDDGWNYLAHERASLALEQEFGHELVPGKHAKRDRQKQPEFPRAATTHDEEQQNQRAKRDLPAFKEEITALYHQSDSGQSLKTALAENGFILATGDKRGFVIVDEQGEVYSLSRQLLDVKAKDLKELLKDIGQLPNVEEAKALQREARETPPTAEPDKPTEPQPHKPTPEQIAKIEEALKERHEREGRELTFRQENELKRTKEIAGEDTTGKLEALKAIHKAEMDAHLRKEKEQYSDDWIRKFYDLIQQKWNPQAAEQQRLERERQQQEIRDRQRIERQTLKETLKIERDQELDDLKARHEAKQREHAGRYQSDLKRYIDEEELSNRLLAQLEKERRQEELTRKPDAPDPPKPSL